MQHEAVGQAPGRRNYINERVTTEQTKRWYSRFQPSATGNVERERRTLRVPPDFAACGRYVLRVDEMEK
jgi:hypothetical protein